MAWYDLFSSFYDASLERLYAQARIDACSELHLRPGDAVLDLPCGTGLSFDVLAPAVGPDGCVLGLDRSPGMLGKARLRAETSGWSHVVTAELDVHDLDAAAVTKLCGRESLDAVLVFLGLTAFERWEEGFERLWSVVRPGGRLVIVDVFAERPGLRGKMVNLVAQADIRRRVWEPLERVGESFERRALPARPEYGGELYVAAATRAPE